MNYITLKSVLSDANNIVKRQIYPTLLIFYIIMASTSFIQLKLNHLQLDFLFSGLIIFFSSIVFIFINYFVHNYINFYLYDEIDDKKYFAAYMKKTSKKLGSFILTVLCFLLILLPIIVINIIVTMIITFSFTKISNNLSLLITIFTFSLLLLLFVIYYKRFLFAFLITLFTDKKGFKVFKYSNYLFKKNKKICNVIFHLGLLISILFGGLSFLFQRYNLTLINTLIIISPFGLYFQIIYVRFFKQIYSNENTGA